MLISKYWISDYVDLDDLSLEDYADLVTTRIAEVENAQQPGEYLTHALIGKITHIDTHAEKPNLKVLKVFDGSDTVQIVTGAQGLRLDECIAFVRPGGKIASLTKLKDDPGAKDEFSVQERVVDVCDIAGIYSQGTLVSEAELNLTSNHTDILRFEEKDKIKIGTRLSELFGSEEIVLEIDNKSLTHRPDLWSHFGFARELAAILKRPLKKDLDTFADDIEAGKALLDKLTSAQTSNYSVSIEKGCGCRRFAGLEISNVKTAPSPLWIRRRLFSVGAGVRNILVDLSNYVMLDTGQPNHAYDIEKLKGNCIFVRRASDGELFTGLDGSERNLTPEDMVIADSVGSLALAGVIGGMDSAISETTSNLLLESANFDPVLVRKTTKRHQLRTDASNRFEKSQSVFSVPLALHRYVELLSKEQPDLQLLNKVADNFVERPKTLKIAFSTSYIRERLGTQVQDNEIQNILGNLKFSVNETDEPLSHTATVPYFRATRDISIQEDLVEEIGRISGYENIPENAPVVAATASASSEIKELEDDIRSLLCGRGFSEIYSYSFMDKKDSIRMGISHDGTVELQNPVDSNQPFMRSTLVPSLINALQYNLKQGGSTTTGTKVSATPGIMLFELGRSYHQISQVSKESLALCKGLDNTAAFERRLLGVCYTSGLNEEDLGNTCRPKITKGADFYSLSLVIEDVCRLLGVKLFRKAPIADRIDSPSKGNDYTSLKSWMHPFRAACLWTNDAVSGREFTVGNISEVSSRFLGLEGVRSVVAELDLDLLLELSKRIEHGTNKFQPISKYPRSYFEVSVVMPKAVEYRSLASIVEKVVPKDRLRGLDVLSVYSGTPLAKHEKSISIRVAFGTNQGTLGTKEIQGLQTSIVAAIEKGGFELRT